MKKSWILDWLDLAYPHYLHWFHLPCEKPPDSFSVITWFLPSPDCALCPSSLSVSDMSLCCVLCTVGGRVMCQSGMTMTMGHIHYIIGVWNELILGPFASMGVSSGARDIRHTRFHLVLMHDSSRVTSLRSNYKHWYIRMGLSHDVRSWLPPSRILFLPLGQCFRKRIQSTSLIWATHVLWSYILLCFCESRWAAAWAASAAAWSHWWWPRTQSSMLSASLTAKSSPLRMSLGRCANLLEGK